MSFILLFFGTHFQDDEYYDMIFKSTNGLLIPGGAVSLTTSGNLIKPFSQNETILDRYVFHISRSFTFSMMIKIVSE